MAITMIMTMGYMRDGACTAYVDREDRMGNLILIRYSVYSNKFIYSFVTAWSFSRKIMTLCDPPTLCSAQFTHVDIKHEFPMGFVPC